MNELRDKYVEASNAQIRYEIELQRKDHANTNNEKMQQEQIKRLPKMALWYDKDLFICFLIGVAIGLVISAIA